MQHPTSWLVEAQRAIEVEMVLNVQIIKNYFITRNNPHQVNFPNITPTHPLKI